MVELKVSTSRQDIIKMVADATEDPGLVAICEQIQEAPRTIYHQAVIDIDHTRASNAWKSIKAYLPKLKGGRRKLTYETAYWICKEIGDTWS